MKKIVITIAVLVVLAVAYWLISPLFIDKVVDESLEDIRNVSEQKPTQQQPTPESENEVTPTLQIIQSGSFEGRSNHRASGSVSLVQSGEDYYVRIEDDFDAENGPDLFVHLGMDGRYDPKVNLGRLKGNKGGQNYAIPSDVNIEEYDEVWIWCRAFTVPFAQAVLN